MASLTAFLPRARAARSSRPVPPVAVVLAATLLFALVNPFGYRGGGSDDWYYLEAARCAVAHHGPCLPTTHWAARLPMVLPLAAALAIFGEGAGVLAAVALVHTLAVMTVFVLLVQRAFGRLEAGIAGIALVATPAFAVQIGGLDIDGVEMAWALGALLCLQEAVRRDDRRWALAAGVLLGIAVMARTTSLLLVPIGIIALLAMPGLRRFALPAAAGLVALLAMDALGYWLASGDPLLDWRLALGHAHLPSTQIAVPIGAHESPLFNRHLIAGWNRSMGIHVHWTIDALLNLLADPSLDLTLLAAAGLLFVERRTAPRAVWLVAGASALDALALIYGLAIDPTPRMFMLVLCGACAIIGTIGAALWRSGGRWPTVAGLGLSAMIAVVMVHDSYRIAPAGPIVAAWAAAAQDDTAIDDTTRRAFPFSPAIARLAVAPAPGKTRLLRLSNDGCPASEDGWQPLRSAAVPDDDGALVAAMRARHWLFAPHAAFAVCLFSRR